MKLAKIDITYFRCFESLAVRLHPDINVIVGSNGAGKSSILDAMAIALYEIVAANGGGGKNQRKMQGAALLTTIDKEKFAYMIGYLGLDCSRLIERRHQHARDLIDTLGEEPASDIVTWLREKYLQPDTNGRVQQFYSLSKAILEP